MRKDKLLKLRENIDELKTIKSEIVKRDKHFVNVIDYNFTLNNGRTIPREQILKNGRDGSAVLIAANLKDTNEFIVVIEPRVFTAKGVSVSFPAGYIEEGETPLEAAKRELREETGYVPKKMEHLDAFYQDEGVSKACNHAFLAIDCEKKYDQKLDKNEIIKCMTFTYEELLEIEKMGYLCGANTKLTLCRVKEYYDRKRR